MSATAGETKEPACRTKDFACVLEPVQSLGTYLWNFALFQKIWLLYCWISVPLLSVSNHPPQYCKGEAGAGGWGGVKVDLLWFSLVVLLNSQLVENRVEDCVAPVRLCLPIYPRLSFSAQDSQLPKSTCPHTTFVSLISVLAVCFYAALIG